MCVFSFFFESVTWDETGIGFEEVPGGSEYRNRSVISWHFYIPPMVSLSLHSSSCLLHNLYWLDLTGNRI